MLSFQLLYQENEKMMVSHFIFYLQVQRCHFWLHCVPFRHYSHNWYTLCCHHSDSQSHSRAHWNRFRFPHHCHHKRPCSTLMMMRMTRRSCRQCHFPSHWTGECSDSRRRWSHPEAHSLSIAESMEIGQKLDVPYRFGWWPHLPLPLRCKMSQVMPHDMPQNPNLAAQRVSPDGNRRDHLLHALNSRMRKWEHPA